MVRSACCVTQVFGLSAILGNFTLHLASTLTQCHTELMPKGPQGQKRPADTHAAAIMVAKIATGEIEETKPQPKSAAAELGSKGGRARSQSVSSERKSEIAKKAAEARWRKLKS